jgi:para-nitrobenzyl esterase
MQPLAIFSQPFHIVPLNEGARVRVWAELTEQSRSEVVA